MAMENSVSLLGDSQTFVGILATLVILCIAQNANNFMFEVLKDIKEEIVNLYITEYFDYNFTHFYEEIREKYQLSPKTIDNISSINHRLKQQHWPSYRLISEDKQTEY